MAAAAPPAARPLSILVADPSPDHADALALLLGGHGHKVGTVHSAPEALRAVASDRPDVVVTEARFLISDGMKLARTIRKVFGDRPALVMVTADPDLEVEARQVGFRGFVVKGGRPDELVGVVEFCGY
jgi:CheY-like chemotaxis protein